MSSIAAVCAVVGSGYYAATKGALELISDALRQEVAPLGITVMTVEPGAFRTRFFDDSLKGTAVKIKDYAETAGKKRKEHIINHHDQPGDPEKAGRIIVDAVEQPNPPQRLLLGSDASAIVCAELERRLAEAQAQKDLSVSSDF